MCSIRRRPTVRFCTDGSTVIGPSPVVEAGEDLRFPLEPCEPIRVSSEGVREDLQGHLAAELRVGGLIDLPHPPLADEGGHVVVSEAVTDGQSHELS